MLDVPAGVPTSASARCRRLRVARREGTTSLVAIPGSTGCAVPRALVTRCLRRRRARRWRHPRAKHADLDASPAVATVSATAPAWPLGGDDWRSLSRRGAGDPAVLTAVHAPRLKLTHTRGRHADITAHGVAPSPFVTCTLDRGADTATTTNNKNNAATATNTAGTVAVDVATAGNDAPPTIRIGGGAGLRGTREWVATEASFDAPQKMTYGKTGDTYWGSQRVQCVAPAASAAEDYVLGLSNDGGASRAVTGVELPYGEQALSLGGRQRWTSRLGLRGERRRHRRGLDQTHRILLIRIRRRPGCAVVPRQRTAHHGVRYLPKGGTSGGGACGFIKQGTDYGVISSGSSASGGRATGAAAVAAPPGRWYHVAYVAAPVGNVAADGTAATRGLLYVDGKVIAQSPSDVVPPPLDEKLYIGGHPTAIAAGSGFHGVVDEVRVYAAALTSTQVNEQIWSSDSAAAVSLALDSKTQTAKALKVHLRFNNLTRSGSAVPDHAYDGTTNVTKLATASDAKVIAGGGGGGGGDPFVSPLGLNGAARRG